MLATLHTTISRLLVEHGGIDPAEVDILFERPTRQWADSLLRPAVDVYMFDLVENMERRNGAPQVARADNRAAFRVPPRRVDLHYLVAAFASHPGDEQTLIWRVLATLLRYSPLPVELLPQAFAGLDLPITTQVGQPELAVAARPFELWNAYELTPRPALIYTITVPLDLALETSSPLVLSRELRFRRMAGEPASETPPTRIGGTVRTADGRPLAGAHLAVAGSSQEVVTDEQGRYSVRINHSGPLTLNVRAAGIVPQSAELAIPSATYDIVVVQA
jgi:hypothetical protein